MANSRSNKLAASRPRSASRLKVYLLWHTDLFEDEKLIGVYQTKALASKAIDRMKEKPGFSEGGKFEVAEYQLNKDYWESGFTRTDGLSLPTWLRVQE